MFCPDCGKKLKKANVKFCPFCGRQISEMDMEEMAEEQKQSTAGTSKVKKPAVAAVAGLVVVALLAKTLHKPAKEDAVKTADSAVTAENSVAIDPSKDDRDEKVKNAADAQSVQDVQNADDTADAEYTQNADSAADAQDTWNADNSVDTSDAAAAAADTAETSFVEPHDYAGNYSFSEERIGLRWAKNMKIDGVNIVAQYDTLVDTTGNPVYALGFKDVKSAYDKSQYITAVKNGDDTVFSPMINGACYCNFTLQDGNSGTYYASVIVDQDGNELCRFMSGANNTYSILGRVGDTFIVLDESSDMSGVKAYIFAVDKNGELVHAPKEMPGYVEVLDGEVYSFYNFISEDRDENDFLDLGDNIFLLKNYGFYNVETGALIHVSNMQDDIELAVQTYDSTWKNPHFVDHKLLFDNYTGDHHYFMLDSSELQNDNYNFSFRTEAPNGAYEQVGKYLLWAEDKYASRADGIMDLDGNKLSFLDAYTKYQGLTVRVSDDEAYLDISFKGMDDCLYGVVLDENGKELYTPVRIGEKMKSGAGGYVLIEDAHYIAKVLFPDGTIHGFDEDLSALNGLTFGNIGENYCFLTTDLVGYDYPDFEETDSNPILRSLDGKNKITSIPMPDETTKYSDLSNLEETPLPDGEGKGSSAAAAVNTDAEKTDNNESAEAVQNQEETFDADTDVRMTTSDDVSGLVLYDNDGITITMTDEDTARVVNNSPDNKMVTVNSYIAYNGLLMDGTNGGSGAMVYGGEEDTMSMGIETNTYYYIVGNLGPAYENIPIEALTYVYTVQFGNDGTPGKTYQYEVRKSNYNEDDIAKLHGEKVGENSDGDITLTNYRLNDSINNSVVVENTNDFDITVAGLGSWWGWIINGEQQTGRLWSLEIPHGMSILVSPEIDPQRYKSQNQISNSLPLGFSLVFPTDGPDGQHGIVEMPCGTMNE